MYDNCFGNGPFLFRLNDNGCGPNLLSQVCLERGWREYSSENGEENWNLWWKTNSFTVAHTKSLSAWQFTNHIPKGSAICRKDNLVRYLRCMKSVYGSIYDFSPDGYNLPLEYTKLAAECNRIKIMPYDKNCNKYPEDKPIWICKPVSKSQGRGIFLFRRLSDLNYDNNTIVQKYIEKPLLIGGYKFDLRLYVCIPSYHPMTIYMYKEGLARFGTDKFNLKDLTNPFRHLTNCSINKLGPNYTEMKDRIGAGCKWTLKHLRRYFIQAGIHDWLLWQKISNLVILTVLSHATQVPETVNCFDFFGFDVLIDEDLRPWLLEVNLSPALSNDCDADRAVKKPMLHDMFDLLGLPIHNTGLGSFDLWLGTDQGSEGEDKSEDLQKQNRYSRTDISKKRKKKTPKKTKSRGANAAKISASLTDSFSKKPLNLARHTLILDSHKMRDEEWKKSKSKTWGNGTDWSFPKTYEGDWIRIWPIKPISTTLRQFMEPLKEVRNVVMEVSKYSKVAKELTRKHSTASDKFLNQRLAEQLNITGEVWLPPS
ncbi:probable tubulin polyglutamylase TTLL2 isoform X1 [Harmonia axyridis]|uniref:probable tubulin polyglutamylase TTLL2 isoform X1 n=1 Tax=Harmonia axyridis TaxID=115357 RepID=UPI001E2799B7|nr:probable tubulin polyglutamylase TTLL2 isoform X1 [Harmonia axyridis]XP_045470830.1 probable tubulin polyglutamylase TTLL2 isoform X1 [Harmonia axyridis]XP_045470831.1 probable tubulin polyglutamylase TTLL2 isoform X1 [Harmonia axyridis]XP_045470832.1 probable tubulin polyglutamylase TTLL2 isoform X1 [Harmonia axyridis]